MSALAVLLPDGRLHLQHGPIDCLCRAWGNAAEVRLAYGQAAVFFGSVLGDLCAELPLLRSALPAWRPDGAIARTMHAACLPFTDRFITPMAAVAGAVADAVLGAMLRGRRLSKAFVNNGGDIAFHLEQGTSLRCGLVSDLTAVPSWTAGGGRPRQSHAATRGANLPNHHIPGRDIPNRDMPGREGVSPPVLALDGMFLLTGAHPARGIATSGRACKTRGGKSFSLGIADSVSVLARTAARADAAATIIGNALDLPGHAAIDRRPANQIDPDSDLGDRLVTFDVNELTDAAIGAALDAGEAVAQKLILDGLIEGVVLTLRDRWRIRLPSLETPEVA